MLTDLFAAIDSGAVDIYIVAGMLLAIIIVNNIVNLR